MRDYILHIKVDERIYKLLGAFAESKKWSKSLAGCEILSNFLNEKNREVA